MAHAAPMIDPSIQSQDEEPAVLDPSVQGQDEMTAALASASTAPEEAALTSITPEETDALASTEETAALTSITEEETAAPASASTTPEEAALASITPEKTATTKETVALTSASPSFLEEEIAALATTNPTLCDTLIVLANSIRTLQKEVRTMKDNQRNNQWKKPSHKKGYCWYCGKARHHQRECRSRISDAAPMRSSPQTDAQPGEDWGN